MLGFGSEMSSPEVHGFEHLVPAVGECCGILGGGVLPEQVADQRQALRSILCFLAVLWKKNVASQTSCSWAYAFSTMMNYIPSKVLPL